MNNIAELIEDISCEGFLSAAIGLSWYFLMKPSVNLVIRDCFFTFYDMFARSFSRIANVIGLTGCFCSSLAVASPSSPLP